MLVAIHQTVELKEQVAIPQELTMDLHLPMQVCTIQLYLPNTSNFIHLKGEHSSAPILVLSAYHFIQQILPREGKSWQRGNMILWVFPQQQIVKYQATWIK